MAINLVNVESSLMSMLVSFVVVWLIHPMVVKVAIDKDFVDKPGRRKDQKKPIPVMGGVAVYLGIVIGLGLCNLLFDVCNMSLLVALTVMAYIGVLDDALGLSPRLRLFVQSFTVVYLMCSLNAMIDNGQGILGIMCLPYWLGVLLSIIAGVGIINAINMIDGVNGLSSGWCIMAAFSFGTLFYACDNLSALLCCSVVIGGLLPFLLHNVFGNKSRMFVGDGGTLMFGAITVALLFQAIDSDVYLIKGIPGLCTIAFSLAVLSAPVFDTLRVMTGRILKKQSPFHADRSHLHHLFLELGYTHVGTAIMVVSLNFMVVLCWYASFLMGASANIQFFVVFTLGFCNTTGFYLIVRKTSEHFLIRRILVWIGERLRPEDTKWYSKIQKVIDRC